MTIWPVLAITAAVASRLAYVVWVGNALRQQDRHQRFTRDVGVTAGFEHFKRRASILMRADALGIVLVCVVTRNTLDVAAAPRLLLAAVLIVAGLGVKLWAARTLGEDAYYWHNFFAPGPHVAPDPPGPYRYLNNPMYTVGYLHAYGLALALGSTAGLWLSLFDQAAILTFHFTVELPHYRRVSLTAE